MKIRKILAVFVAFCIFTTGTMQVSASNYQLSIEKENAETQYLENDQGYINKKIINSDLSNGEVTIELELINAKKDTQEIRYSDTEIIVIVPTIYTEEEYNHYINSLKQMANTIISDNVKLGIIEIQGALGGNTYGTITDSKLIIKPTNNANEFINNLSSITLKTESNSHEEKIYNNLESALLVAAHSFSNETNKILVLPYIKPDSSSSEHAIYQHGGWTGLSLEEASRQHIKKIIADTKEVLLDLRNHSIDVLMLRPADNAWDFTPKNPDTGESSGVTYDFSEYLKDLYGTLSNPTIGLAFDNQTVNLNDFLIDKTRNYVETLTQSAIKNISLIDYFPKDIVDNFSFSYVTKPTNGTISSKISDDNTITYSVEQLKGNESIKITYKLKLKDMNKKTLLDKVINTNEKVVIKYTDNKSLEHETTLTSSPSIKLIKIEENNQITENPNQQEQKDNIESTVPNPPTGLYISVGILGAVMIGIIIVTIFRKKNYFNKI